MSTYTENYNLIKPDEEDYYDVQDFNENMDVIDAQMMETETAIGQIDKKIGTPITDGDTLFSLLGSGGSLIKSAQRVKYTITKTNTTSGTINIKAVDPNKCFVLFERLANYYSNGEPYVDYQLAETTLTIFHEANGSIPAKEHFMLGFWIIEFN